MRASLDNLLGELGFDVNRVLDGDAEDLREEIAEFVEDAAEADVALIYYSGHGVELGGANYLVPTDTDLASPEAAGREPRRRSMRSSPTSPRPCR